MKKIPMIFMMLVCLTLLLTACTDGMLNTPTTAEQNTTTQSPTDTPTDASTTESTPETTDEQLNDGKMNPDASYDDIFPLS